MGKDLRDKLNKIGEKYFFDDPNIRYTIIYSEVHERYDLFRDIKGIDNVELIIIKKRVIKNAFLKIVRKIHLSKIIGKCLNIPYQWKWFEPVDLNIDEKKIHYVILFDLALQGLPIKYLKKEIDRTNVRSVFFFINSINNDLMKCVFPEMLKIDWNKVVSFDNENADKYGFEKGIYQYYSKREIDFLEKNDKTDICFIGTLKNSRYKKILPIYELLKDNGLVLDFHLMKTGVGRIKSYLYEDEIDYYTYENGRKSYDDVIKYVQRTGTILEILQSNQNGPTLRYFEAICYNKKLLTNNSSVKELPLYDERFIKVFTKPEDIDIDWLRKDYCINYNYNNEFSPLFLLEKVRDLFM